MKLEEKISNLSVYLSLIPMQWNIVFDGDKHKAKFREQRSQYTSNGLILTVGKKNEVGVKAFPDVICENLRKIFHTSP